MKDIISEPVTTTFVLHGQTHTHIQPETFRHADLSEFDPAMNGSVEVNLRGTTCRVPAVRHECGSISTGEVLIAVTPKLRPARACLFLTVDGPEMVMIWTTPVDAPRGAESIWLAFSDDDSVVRVVAPWEINQTTPFYFLVAYGFLTLDRLPPNCDAGDTIATLVHERGSNVFLDLRREPPPMLDLVPSQD